MAWVLVGVTLAACAVCLAALFAYRRAVRELQVQQAHLEQLFETFPHALTLRTTDGRLLRANAEFTRLFGYALPEVVGVDVGRLLAGPGNEPDVGAARLLSSTSRIWRQAKRRRRDGSTVEVSHTGAPILVGGAPVALYEVYHDLTQQLRNEETITNQQQQLEMFFAQSLDGFFFMMLDQPIRWEPGKDNHALLEYAFAHHRITRINDAMLAQYGYTREQMTGLTPADLYAHDLEEGRRNWTRFFDAGRLHTITNERKADGTPILVEGDYICLYDEQGRITGHFGIQRDITERAAQEQALRESEEKFAKAFRSSPFPITIATLDEGRFIEVNEAFLRDVGFTREQVIGHTAPELGLWRDPAARTEFVRRLERDGMVREYEFEARTRNRERQINHIWAEKITLGGTVCLLDIVWDVTEWRLNEEALRSSRQELRGLATKQQQVREEERTRIARELHDELGQQLTGLKMDLSWMKGRVSKGQPEVGERMQDVIRRVDGTVDAVRRIATELRPGVLDLLGLAAAIEWQAQEFRRRTGIHTDLNLHSDNAAVDDVRSTTIFRILQEALTNVARHANATRVAIEFHQGDDELALEVRDNGRGITTPTTTGSGSLGLVGIRERAIACGGYLSIDSVPGTGTSIVVRIPLAEPAAPEVVS
jgi:PAS domain S-box-containing protein